MKLTSITALKNGASRTATTAPVPARIARSRSVTVIRSAMPRIRLKW